MGGGISDWHKKQRKKELEKHKEARIKARDEKVLQFKTSREIQEEIRNLEKQHNVDNRPHQIQMKLDRLNKELKLVTKKEAEQPKPSMKPVPKQQSNFVELANPAVSVYYDAVLNPFGAPPPGMPNLYHKLGGGTTMNLKEAGLPGQAAPPPPPPPPLPKDVPKNTQQQIQQNTQSKIRKDSGDDARQKPVEKREASHLSDSSMPKKTAIEEKKQFDPNKLPELPKPSRAVERSRRRMNIDIWASNEEVEYETQMEQHSHETWYYKDASGNIQGPFPTTQMKEWYKAGYFPNTILVSGTHRSGPWKAFSKTKQLQKQKTKSRASNSKNADSVQSRIAQLRAEQRPADSVQSRIAALKKVDRSVEDPLSLPEETSDEVQNRIAAHRKANEKEGKAGDDDENSTNSVQDRIAALKRGSADQDEPPAVIGPEIRPASESNTTDYRVSSEPMVPPLPPLPLNGVGESELPSYPVDDGELMMPPPPPPPKTDDMPSYPVDDATAAYPVDETELGPPPAGPLDEMPTYPLDDVVAPYPTDSDDNDAVQGVVAPYLVAGDDSYPVLGEYPVENGFKEQEHAPEPPRKKAKVDKALVAFLPSHLRKRKKSSNTS